MIVCIPSVLELTELRRVREGLAAEAFIDGKTTAGARAKRVKHNLQLPAKAEGASELKSLVVRGLERNRTFQRVALPKTVHRPLISRYEVGMAYGRHVDNALMGKSGNGRKARSDLSVTVFLSDPGDYDGGELMLESPFEEMPIKLPAGAAAVYPSGALHRVAPVTRGVRLAAVTWVESYVRDPARREVLHDLDLIRCKLAEAEPGWDETDLAHKAYSNLLRMWSET